MYKPIQPGFSLSRETFPGVLSQGAVPDMLEGLSDICLLGRVSHCHDSATSLPCYSSRGEMSSCKEKETLPST